MPSINEVAAIVRSKNAGPFLLTFDIICDNRAAYERLRNSGSLTHEAIARLYGIDSQKVSIFDYPDAYAFKVTIPRMVTSGDPEDQDVYGAQQHILISQIEIP